MGISQDFKDRYDGLQFYLVHQVDGLAEYKSDVIVVPEEDLEVFVKIIVSLRDNFKMPQEMFIGDIYKTAEKIHDISQYRLIPHKTHTIYNCIEHS
jgi:hypothetical protein